MKKYITLLLIFSIFAFASCVNDLDVEPKDPSSILADNVKDNPEYLQQALAKIYASFVIAGQGGDGDKGADIAAPDEAFFTTTRALWNLQEITTDEAICAWGDPGIADLNTQTWSPANPFLTALYQRLSLSVTYANNFISLTKESTDPEIAKYHAEARFLRALAYYWQMDLFGNPPFTTEDNGVGKYYPEQIQRKDLFDFIVSELKAAEEVLGEPGSSYPQADKAAAWMLLARTYLNAEVYTGTAQWAEAKEYCDKVINSGAYKLNDKYRNNFCADNGYPNNKEMIFAWDLDNTHVQGPVATTFIIQSSSDATYLPAEDYHGLHVNTNWNGNRARKDFMNILVDTVSTYGNVPVPEDDEEFKRCADNRVYLKQKRTIDIPSPSASGDYGVGVYKFTAVNSNGDELMNPATYASTDFPIFRLADAYLMRAEAQLRMGNVGDAVTDVNVIRGRAFDNGEGDISAAQLTLDFLLDERAREFYYEAQRRTDLVRFGQFTSGTYHWQWKGGDFDGISTASHRDIFPIPGDEISANPNIKQNTGY